MPDKQERRPLSGTGVKDYRQEVEIILLHASRERWVIAEARAILEARAMKMALEESLGLEPSERFTPEESRRVCIFGALVECAI